MLPLLTPPQHPSPAALSPAQEFLRVAGLTEALPDRLIQDRDGRVFEPVQLGPAQDQASLPDHLVHLLRPEPLGGAEPMIQRNKEQMLEQALLRLRRRLVSGGDGLPTRSLLAAIQADLRPLQVQLDAQTQQVAQDYDRTQALLRTWQDRTTRQASESMLGGLARWLVGSGVLSLPQAMLCWNEREYLFLRRGAYQAALALVSQILDDSTTLLEHLDAMAAHAARLAREAGQRRSLPSGQQPYVPLTVRVEAARVADRLVSQLDAEALVIALLGELHVSGAAQLGEQARALSQQEAARRLADLDLYQLLVIDAGDALLPEADPMVLIGQGLLDSLSRQQSWQLVGTARPRRELLQVTADGQPLYSMDGLGTAAYGEPGDRLGFVQIEIGVATHELRIVAESRELFAEALRQRNLYALDMLAVGWEERAAMAPAAAPVHGAVAAESPNGSDPVR